MKAIKLISLYIACLLTSTPAISQTQIIRGTVVDAKAKYPLIGATIIQLYSDPLVGTTTDTEGHFRLENIPVGRVAISIGYVGYKSTVIPNVLLVSGKEAVIQVELQESVEHLEGITVTAKSQKSQPINNLAKVSARTFNLEEITRFSGGRNDVARLVTSFAGVSAPSDSRNDIVVRGNSPTGLLWRIEGIPIASTNHFATLGTTGAPVNALNTNVLRTSDFLTGAFPSEYGNSNAAVFDVNFRNGNSEKYEFTGQIALTGVELMGEGPISKENNSSFLASYRYGIAVLVSTGTTAIPFYQDLSFKVNLGKSRYGKFEVFGMGGLSNIDFLGNKVNENDLFANPNQDAYVKNQLGLIGVSNTLTINNNTYLKTALGVSTNYNEYLQDNLVKDNNGKQISKYRAINVHNRENRYTLSSILNKKFNAKWSLRAGLLSEVYGIRFFTESRQDSTSISDKNRDGVPDYFLKALDINDYYNISQIFGQTEYTLTDEINFTVGLHIQYHTFSKKLAVEPRAAASWQFSNIQRISLAYGLHSQSIPSPILFYEEEIAPQQYSRTNKKVDFMKSHHVVIAYDLTPTPDWRVKVEAYYQHLFNIPIEQTSSSYSIINEGSNFAFTPKGSLTNKGKGDNYGMELTIEKFLSHGYYTLLTASLYKSTYAGSDNIVRSTAFDNSVIGNLLAGKEWLFGKHKQNAIMLDTKVALSRGRPYTPIDLDATQKTGGIKEVYVENKAYSKHFKPYFRWDLKVGVRANIKKTSHEWYVEVQNITNNRNEFAKRYSVSKKDIRTVRQTGIYPVFLYRIRF